MSTQNFIREIDINRVIEERVAVAVHNIQSASGTACLTAADFCADAEEIAKCVRPVVTVCVSEGMKYREEWMRASDSCNYINRGLQLARSNWGTMSREQFEDELAKLG